MTVKIC